MKKKSKKKKRKVFLKKLRILIFLGIIISAIGFLIYFALQSSKPSEAINTLNTYMAYINEEKYEEMYNMITSSSKNRISKEEFIKKHEGVYSELEANNVQLSDISEEEENRKSKNCIHNRDGYNCRNIKISKHSKT